MKILFWNTHNNEDINEILSELIIENNISIVVLAEYKASVDELFAILSAQGINMSSYITTGCERIKIFGVLSNVEPATQTHYASMQVINKKDILCCIHLPSKIYGNSEAMQEIVTRQIISDIRSLEMELNTENTIVVGDFNSNPYESGCVNATLFHGIPVYNEAKRRSRIIADQEFHMFYNPMWSFLGDAIEPYGTYYHGGSGANNTYWHIYDQVIIRPVLRERFVDSNLKILTETSSRYLLNRKGYPNTEISDHLPIMFEIKEDNYGKKTGF